MFNRFIVLVAGTGFFFRAAQKKKSTLMGAFLFSFVAGTGLEPVTFGL